MAVTTTHIPTIGPTAATAGKILKLRLGAACFGIAIAEVREIIRLGQITPVPRMPDYIKGIINLRGRLIPLVDLRLRLGMEPTEIGARTCVVVVQPARQNGSGDLFGLLADAVEEVAQIGEPDRQPAPWFGPDTPTDFIDGLIRKDGSVCMLLNLQHALSEAVTVSSPPLRGGPDPSGNL